MAENKRVNGVATLPIGVITPCITGEGGPTFVIFLVMQGDHTTLFNWNY